MERLDSSVRGISTGFHLNPPIYCCMTLCLFRNFKGSSSGFSIFSPRGIQWVNEKTGDTSFQDMIMNATAQDSGKMFPTKNSVFGQLFENHKRNPMPPKGPTITLVTGVCPSFWKHMPEHLLNGKCYSQIFS